jgi:hypothetical protein
MATLREYFEREAGELLDRLGALAAPTPAPGGAGELHRLARELRGAARLAREERVSRLARQVEVAAREAAALSTSLDVTLRAQIATTVADLRHLVAGVEPEATADARLSAALGRWPATDAATGAAGCDVGGFDAYAAREVAAIAAALGRAVDVLAEEPNDRDLLAAVLRRQRPLLGAAGLEALPIVAEALRAIEDVARIDALRDVKHRQDWLEAFRCARDLLTGAAAALASGAQPQPSAALDRLRTLHEELLEPHRQSANATPSAEAALPGPAGAGADGAESVPAATAEAEAVPVERLCYDDAGAIRRALELREAIEQAVGSDPLGAAAVDELFDLLRIARG